MSDFNTEGWLLCTNVHPTTHQIRVLRNYVYIQQQNRLEENIMLTRLCFLLTNVNLHIWQKAKMFFILEIQ